ECFPAVPASWRDDALAEKWRRVRNVRRVVTGALEIERAAKRIGSSLEAAPVVYVSDPDLFEALVGIELAEVAITSDATLVGAEVAALSAVLGLAVRLWLVCGFDLGGRGVVSLTPFLDLVLAWNTGISYGLFPQDGPIGQWVLLALKAAAVVLLWIWLARTS